MLLKKEKWNSQDDVICSTSKVNIIKGEERLCPKYSSVSRSQVAEGSKKGHLGKGNDTSINSR